VEIRETIISSLNNIRMSKMRSALTMLGIIIGVGAVILLSSIGNGQTYLLKQAFNHMGQNTLLVGLNQKFHDRQSIPYWASLNKDDINFLSENPNVQSVSPVQQMMPSYIKISKPKYNIDDGSFIDFEGVGHSYFNITGMKFLNGMSFPDDTKGDYTVIGNILAKKLFKHENPINKIITLTINGKQEGFQGVYKFKVFGVVQNPYAKLSKINQGGGEWGYLMYIPINYYLKITNETLVPFIWTKIKNNVNNTIVSYQLINSLASIKNLPRDMFQARHVSQWITNSSKALSKTNLFVILIASISLLVGGIGIMNIMLVTVSERTKEIGIRKALGATNSNILFQFLIEAVILTVMGGIIGIIVGYIGSLIIGDVIGIPPVLNWGMVVFAFLISVGIGIVFGVIPARKAAKLNPIDALRHD